VLLSEPRNSSFGREHSGRVPVAGGLQFEAGAVRLTRNAAEDAWIGSWLTLGTTGPLERRLRL
jgi:hypothetical protein